MSPSRLLWFIIGGATATWLMRDRTHPLTLCRPATNREDQPELGTSDPAAAAALHSRPWGSHPYQWGEEKARMRALSRQAGDSMAELSDATLDALLSTAGALKAKLAEYREQRDREQRGP